MIHHVSIPARDPQRVARVLAELLGGYAGPFIGPMPGAWVVYQEDGLGTGIEVYTEDTLIVPGENDTLGRVERGQPPQAVAFHALISVKADRATIERIGAREGWRTLHFWRGPPGVRLPPCGGEDPGRSAAWSPKAPSRRGRRARAENRSPHRLRARASRRPARQ